MSLGPASTFAYPVFLDLHDVPVLVVGGGRIGARKAEGLTAAGVRTTDAFDSMLATGSFGAEKGFVRFPRE